MRTLAAALTLLPALALADSTRLELVNGSLPVESCWLEGDRVGWARAGRYAYLPRAEVADPTGCTGAGPPPGAQPAQAAPPPPAPDPRRLPPAPRVATPPPVVAPGPSPLAQAVAEQTAALQAQRVAQAQAEAAQAEAARLQRWKDTQRTEARYEMERALALRATCARDYTTAAGRTACWTAATDRLRYWESVYRSYD